MNKALVLLAFIVSGCANRGYNTLSEEVPELFPDFKVENYHKRETPKNVVYVEKTLSEEEKSKEEFYQAEYEKRKKPDSYSYYIPKERMPSLIDENLLGNMEKIKTTGNKKIKAILIK